MLTKAAVLIAAVTLVGACEKKPKGANDPNVINAMDQANGGDPMKAGTGDDKTVDTTPLPGVDLKKLSAERQKIFYKLVGSLSSPCGKAHSLRTSFTTDQSCRRAPFAIRYLQMLLEDDAPEDKARELFESKYKAAGTPVKFDVSKAPHAGNDDAPVRLVEFFDYGCPHCAAFKPMMEQILSDESGKVVAYFMMFPIESKHPDSRSAAQAALAAAQQGKFREMHDVLFAKYPAHKHDDVAGYAKDLGLDLGKFEKDYDAAASQVTADEKQAETAQVDSTPTVFFNDRKYEGPIAVKYLEAWIDEEIAVNR